MTTTSTCRRSCAAEVSICLPLRDKPASKDSGPTSMQPGRQQLPDTDHVSVRVRRVTTTRAGGVSKPPFDTFNLGDHVGDDPAAVAENRARLAAAVGLRPGRVVWMNQVHGDRVEVVDGPREAAVEDTDALVTRTARLALAVVTADCVPVLMADARAGWPRRCTPAGSVPSAAWWRARWRRCSSWGRSPTTSRPCWVRRSAATTTRCRRRWPTRSKLRCRAVAPSPVPEPRA